MIYFLDGNQEVIKIVRSSAVISAIQTQELPEDNSLLRDYLSVRLKNDERLFNAQYMAIKSYGGNRNAFDLYRTASELVPDNATEFMGVQVAPYELEGVVIEDLRPQDRPLNQAMNQVLEGSDWRLGYMSDNLPSVTTNFYYMSVKDALKKIQELLNVEMLFKVEITGNKITDKWVEVYHQLGNRTMKRFNYGTNALSVVRESSHDELYTALIGRGKGEEVGETESGDATYGRKIDFADVEWKKSAGNPVDKPKGQKYIELPNATVEYGIKLIDGRKVPRIGIVEFSETDDPEKLIQETYQELLVRARPKVLFKASVINTGDMLIGDTVTIHRHDLGFHYQARVRKVVRDRKNNNKTQVEIGDVVHTASTKRQGQINSALNNVASDLENVRGEVTEARQSADGKNTNFYGNVEPERKKAGDTWFRDHPSLTGESQILVWNGEAWELTMDTSETTKNADAIAEQQQEIDAAKEAADEAIDRINNEIASEFTAIDDDILAIETISNSAQANAQTALNQSLDALGDANTALTNAQTALNRADSLSGDITSINVAIDILNGALSLKADSSLVDTISQTVNNHSLAIVANAQGLALKANQSTVDALTGRVTTAETGISANATAIGLKAEQSTVDTLAGTVNTLSGRVDVTAGQISSKVWNTDIQTAIDGIEVGGRNLLLNSSLNGTPFRYDHVNKSGEGGLRILSKLGFSELPKQPYEYTLSMRIRGVSSQNIVLYRISKTGNSAVRLVGSSELTQDFKEVSLTFKPHRAELTDLFIYTACHVTPYTGWFEIDCNSLKLEKGNKATDWTPAPEDTTALINHVESELTQRHDSITATVSSIDGRVATNKLNLDGTITRVGNAEGKITTIETNVSGLQTTVAGKASQSQVTQLSNLVDTKVTASQVNASILADKRYKDTRNDNQLPSWYYNNYTRETVREFKVLSTMGISGEGTFGILETIVPWADASGGGIKQTLRTDHGVWEREQNGPWAWKAWRKTADRTWVGAQVSVLENNINLRVAKGDVVSQLNIDAGRTLISSSKILLNANTVSISGTAWMSGAVITNASIDGAKIADATIGHAKIASVDASKISTGIMDGIVIRSQFNYSYDGAIRNQGTTTIKDGAISSIGTFTHSHGSTYMNITPDRIYAENLMANRSVRSQFILDGQGVTVVSLGEIAHYRQDGISFPQGNALVKYYDASARIEVGSHNGVTLSAVQKSTRGLLTRLSVGGGNDGLDPFVDIYTRLNMRFNHIDNVSKIDIRNANASLSGAQLKVTSDNWLEMAGRWGTRVGHMSQNHSAFYVRAEFSTGDIKFYANLNMQNRTIINQSDERLKRDIIYDEIDSLDAIENWGIAGFYWRNTDASTERQFGVIAQTAPEISSMDDNGYLNVNSSKQLQMVTHGLQQLASRELNTNTIASQALQLGESNEEKIKRLEKRIEELESAA